MLTLRQMRRDARLRRGFGGQAGGILLLAVVAGGMVWWAVRPPAAIAARMIPTGASFNIAISQPRDAAQARAVAAGIERSGFPAFTRTLRRGTQVIVGPFVDLAEADRAQTRLAARGYTARLIVDESVRRAPGFGGTPTPGIGVQVLLVSGAGRLSVVMELPAEPREVSSRRVSPDVLEVDIAPAPVRMQRQRWHTPAGMQLVEEVSVAEIGGGSERVMRARLAVSEFALTNVRTLGRRLYIDIWAGNGLETRAAQRLAARKGPPYGSEPRDGSEVAGRPSREVVGRPLTGRQEYGERIAPALARFQSMEPFVLSSVASPSPDVLAALEGSLRGLEGWIQEIPPPAESARAHASLLSAVKVAIEAVRPSFGGDRMARAKEAFATVAALKAATSYHLPATS